MFMQLTKVLLMLALVLQILENKSNAKTFWKPNPLIRTVYTNAFDHIVYVIVERMHTFLLFFSRMPSDSVLLKPSERLRLSTLKSSWGFSNALPRLNSAFLIICKKKKNMMVKILYHSVSFVHLGNVDEIHILFSAYFYLNAQYNKRLTWLPLSYLSSLCQSPLSL